jgi:hypothetical protein
MADRLRDDEKFTPEDQLPPGFMDKVRDLVAKAKVKKASVPWVAGRSPDGKIVWKDFDVPDEVDGVKTDETLPFHEIGELIRMDAGENYDKDSDPPGTAHYDANGAEKIAVEERGGNWLEYCKAFRPIIKDVDHESLTDLPPREQWDLRPFEEDDRRLLEEILAREDEQTEAQKAGVDRRGVRPLSDAPGTDAQAMKSTFSAPPSATSGLQGYDLEGAARELLSKASVGYIDGPVEHEPCQDCTMFVKCRNKEDKNRCTLVEGDIKARGHCREFKATAAAKAHVGDGLIDKETAEYTRGPVMVEPCKECSTFVRPASCSKVEGAISPDGHCKFWAARSEDDEDGAPNVSGGILLTGEEEDAGKAAPSQQSKRSLYVHRPLTNANELIAWAKAAGFKTTLVADDLHVTIAFSRKAIDWDAAGESYDALVVPAVVDGVDPKRAVERLGDDGRAVVLRFESPELAARHQHFRQMGASWDHDAYRPHVTISWDADEFDVSTIEPYRGRLEFGAEVFAEVKENWSDDITEKRVIKGAAVAPAGETEMSKLSLFVPIKKVDAVQRMVYGTAVAEVPDRTKEIFDYDSSKPLFQAWSADFAKVTDGRSVGNVRAMHGHVAAGKLTEIGFDDTRKAIDVAAKIVDESEWAKVEEGVYTGFSIGGRYEKKWKDGDLTRYTAAPAEVSLVDLPCVPTALFSMVKADGTEELRKFKSVEGPRAPTAADVVAKAEELAKAAGDESKWADHIEVAAAALKATASTADQAVPKGGTSTPQHEGRQGHLGNEGDTETLEDDETDPKPGATKPKPKDHAAAQGKEPPVVSDKQKGAGADSSVSHKGTAADDGTEQQVWIHPRLQGRVFKAKADMRQALVDLDASEAASKKAAPVLDVLKGISEALDARDVRPGAKFAVGKALQTYNELPKAVVLAVSKAAQMAAEDWQLVKEVADTAAQDSALAKAISVLPPITVGKDGAITVPPETAAAIAQFVEQAKAAKKIAADAATLGKKDYSDDDRKKMAAEGRAMKDGSFPINDKDDLKNAVDSYGRSKNKAAAKRHIIKRAKALGATDMLPDGWVKSKKADKAADAGNLAKAASLYVVADMLYLLAAIENFEESIEMPGYGWGGVDVPKELTDRFGAALVEIGDITAQLLDVVLGSMREEEAGEAMARAATINDLMKIGARNSKADKDRIKKVHDLATELDDECCPGGAGKSADIDDLKKLLVEAQQQKQAQESAFEKTIGGIADLLKDIGARVKRIEDTPLPAGPNNYRVVEKGHEQAGAGGDAERAPHATGPWSPYEYRNGLGRVSVVATNPTK